MSHVHAHLIRAVNEEGETGFIAVCARGWRSPWSESKALVHLAHAQHNLDERAHVA